MKEKDMKFMSDADVELEMAELSESEYVKLARKEQRLKYKYRQKLYMLRHLDKRGRELASQGITLDTIAELINKLDKEEQNDD